MRRLHLERSVCGVPVSLLTDAVVRYKMFITSGWRCSRCGRLFPDPGRLHLPHWWSVRVCWCSLRLLDRIEEAESALGWSATPDWPGTALWGSGFVSDDLPRGQRHAGSCREWVWK